MPGKDKGWDYLNSDDVNDTFNTNDDDSSWGYKNDDGSGSYYGEDGSWGYQNADGSGSYYGADGSWGYKNADGSGSYYGADGSWGYKNSDGSGSFYESDNSSTHYDVDDADDDDDDDDSSSGGSFAESLGSAFGTILGAGMAAAMAEERAKEAQKEAERKERQAKNKAWRKKHRKGLSIVILVCVIALLGAIGYYEYSISIPVGYDDTDFVGQNYQEVIRQLERSGFKYVSEKAVEDLLIEDIERDYLVSEVKIGWSDSFDENSRYPANLPVVVKYHTLETVDVPISSKDAKKSDYETVLKLFEDAGFANIKVIVEYDIITGWLTDDGDIESVVINEDKKFYEGDSYRADAEVVITYHTLKKNKPK